MKLTILNRNLTSTRTLNSVIQARILELAQRLRIDTARVAIEYVPEASPAYRVGVHLAVPGPDLRAERNDHTIFQAFTRAMHDIEIRLRERTRNRLARSAARMLRTSAPGVRAASFR